LTARRFLGARIAALLLALLGLVAFLGTWDAAERGVLAARERWFDALVAWLPLGAGLALPLPGARLLLLLLFAALVLDRAAWRMRPGRRALPLVHAGVALLLGSALWSALAAREASVTLAPGADTEQARWESALPPPFTLRVLAVHRSYHPRTAIPATLAVDVEVAAASGPPQCARIDLHTPLHRDGVSVHLRNDPEGMVPADAPVELVFRRDPAQSVRMAACALLCLGLLAHFAGRLLRSRQS